MQKVTADLKYYNANTRGKSVGDCAKRSLSVAYSMDYDEVSRELNEIKRSIGANHYNENIVIRTFCNRRGDKFVTVPSSESITVDEFSEDHSSGVYVLFVGKTLDTRSTHAVAVVNGTVYDSWNCLTWYIYQYCEVSNGASAEYDFDMEDLQAELNDSTSQCLIDMHEKFPIKYVAQLYLHSSFQEDQYTLSQLLICKLGDSVPDSCRWPSGKKFRHNLILKANPRLSVEENLASLKKKSKQKAYDWFYNIKKEILDAEKLESIGINPKFRGDKQLLMKLPAWAIPKMTYATHENWGYCAYEADMDADPNDPRYNEYPEVGFHADTLSELKDQLNSYKDGFARYNFDY